MCVNFKDKAVFTFIYDAKLCIKVAVLDLAKIDKNQEEEAKKQMDWVLKLEQSEHKIDRFHFKCGIAMADDRIAVVARGRLSEMREQVASLILYFSIAKVDDRWTATMLAPQIIWPTIFPRQLDLI